VGLGEVMALLTMNSATALVTSHNTEGEQVGLGEVEALLTMNSATALVTSEKANHELCHCTDDVTQQLKACCRLSQQNSNHRPLSLH
jgi:hypothetical protein